jgi:hypothetical protein
MFTTLKKEYFSSLRSQLTTLPQVLTSTSDELSP